MWAELWTFNKEYINILCLGGYKSTFTMVGCLCPSQIIMLNPNPQSDGIRNGAFRRWLIHKGLALMSQINVLIKSLQRPP